MKYLYSKVTYKLALYDHCTMTIEDSGTFNIQNIRHKLVSTYLLGTDTSVSSLAVRLPLIHWLVSVFHTQYGSRDPIQSLRTTVERVSTVQPGADSSDYYCICEINIKIM